MKTQKRGGWVRLILVFLTLSCLSSRVAVAQVTAGLIRGLITDPSEATLPEVQVEAINLALATELKFSTTSTAAGIYVPTGLPIGNYRVVAQRTGFKQFSQQPVVIDYGVNSVL